MSLDVCCLSIEHSGPPGSDLRACEGFCSEVCVQAQRCFAESEPGSDVFSSEVDVVVMLAVPGSLPSLSCGGCRRFWPMSRNLQDRVDLGPLLAAFSVAFLAAFFSVVKDADDFGLMS